tara:strand:+ start:4151 stop:4810 length:660 start_codon:yes stop_codon:yes gene_type:complete
MRNINSILFDFDGVIVESNNIKTQAFYSLYIDYGEDIAKAVVNHHKQNMGISRFEKIKLYHKKFLGKALNGSDYNELLNKFSISVMDKTIRSPYVSGSYEFIKSNFTIFDQYIITATPMSEIEKITKKRNIYKYFKKVLGSPNSKDFWVKHLIDNKKIDSKSSIFIGDAKADKQAALDNDITFILRKTNENKNLQNSTHYDAISDFHDLVKIINRLNRV